MFIKWSESSRKEHKYTFFYKVTGERYGDRLGMTYHHSVNTMNKEFQDDGDRLKEELIKSIRNEIIIWVFFQSARCLNYAALARTIVSIFQIYEKIMHRLK